MNAVSKAEPMDRNTVPMQADRAATMHESARDALFGAIADLESVIDRHELKIGNVLDPGAQPLEASGEVMSPAAPVTEVLRRAAEQVRAQTSRIHALTERIDL